LIRCCQLGRDRGLAGLLTEVSSYTMKHPPIQYTDYEARRLLKGFIDGPAKAKKK
jgi:myo-inositol-1-phosphate synthase